jgi:hypothetical protein
MLYYISLATVIATGAKTIFELNCLPSGENFSTKKVLNIYSENIICFTRLELEYLGGYSPAISPNNNGL